MNWNWIISPAAGMVIGYFTNWLAVKMLFRPREAKYILGHRVPFTPGAIPKGKPNLAKAVAGAVTGSLLTREDLRSKAISPELTEKLTEGAMELLTRDIDQLLAGFDSEKVEHVKAAITDVITAKVLSAVKDLPIAELITEKGGAAIKEKLHGNPLLQMFINDSVIASYSKPIADAVYGYIDESGYALVSGTVRREIDGVTAQTGAELLYKGGMDSEKIRALVVRAYTKTVDKALDSVLDQMDLGRVIEDKINDMSVDMLEELVLSVMKNELRLIVNLGAVIGLVLGFVNAALNTIL